MNPNHPCYPVESLIPDLRNALRNNRCVVLSAAPGAGKSTVLPLALLDGDFLGENRKIILLEPRRLVTYAVAARLAENANTPLGGVVGYTMRLEQRRSAATRLEVMTEGVLSRRIQRDPELPQVGLVIFDEFHERSLQSDLALALARDVQKNLRNDLKILVMSATLECDRLATLLDHAPILHSEGRMFPLEIRYAPMRPPTRGTVTTDLAFSVAQCVRNALLTEAGSLLAFLPGEREIRRTEALLRDFCQTNAIHLYPLFGKLSTAEQRAAIQPTPPGERKVVLASSIAESSLTIDGVRLVVDSGLRRINLFSPETGMNALTTVAASQASCAQRAGRAGRTEPGIVYRLWSEQEQARRPLATPGEITFSDLSRLALELAAWGESDLEKLDFLDLPPAALWESARKLLRTLNALDDAGKITQHGKAMADLALHPRLSHMLLRAKEHSPELLRLACRIAGLLEGYDFRKKNAVSEEQAADFSAFLAPRLFEHDPAMREARKLAENLEKMCHLAPGVCASPERFAGTLAAFAYPDRIGKRRSDNVNETRYLLRCGRGGAFRNSNLLCRERFLVALQLEDSTENAQIQLAAALEEAELMQHFQSDLIRESHWEFEAEGCALQATEQLRLGAIVLQERRLTELSPEKMLEAADDFLRHNPLRMLNLPESFVELQKRVAFARNMDPSGNWPDFSDEFLETHAKEWLSGFLPQRFSKRFLSEIRFQAALESKLNYAAQMRLKEFAPPRYQVPEGSLLKIDYSNPQQPVLAVKIQQMFGCTEQPAIWNGKCKLLLHLLSPAGRPVQITQDLKGFWEGSYILVRKDLKGRYPKHDWPDEPQTAKPEKFCKKHKK